MKIVIIFGPPAVGKMTVGQELARLTGLKLFHNHMSLELVNQFFDFGTSHFDQLDKAIRFAIFHEIAKSELEGLIFTLVWDLDFKEDHAYVEELIGVFEHKKTEVFFVELQATQEERLIRNRHEHRLAHKASKRNLEHSEKSLRYFDSTYRMNSVEGEFSGKNFLKIDNTHAGPMEVARLIREAFNL